MPIMDHARASAPGSTMDKDMEAVELLYQPMVLENALNCVFNQYRQDHDEPLTTPMDALPSLLQMFQCFVNKLSLVCDSERGGRTVTAIAILQGKDCAVYVLASNYRSAPEQKNVEDFLTNLLHFIHQNPHELERKALTKKILWHMIQFNIERVKAYLVNLPRYLNECIADCQSREQSNVELEKELRVLSGKASFTHDANSDNEKQKFFSDCESLLKAIHAFKENGMNRIILRQSECHEKRSQELWRELRHCLGRLLSYRQAAEVVIATHDWWPRLFHGFIINSVPPSKRMHKPISNNSLGAATIVRNMTREDEDLEEYLENVAILQEIGLGDQIRAQLTRKSFRPIVHAEVQVHSALIRSSITRPQKFWNGYKYIGSSKPTCRLCSYYFHNHWDNVQTRPSHGNLYLNWRLPDLYLTEQSSEARNSRELLARMTEHVRNDAKRTLREGFASRRKHDSSDSSHIPKLYDSSIGWTSSFLNNVPSDASGACLRVHKNWVDNGKRPLGEDLSSMLGDFDSESDEGGASIVFG